jgi:hypothetical protein
MERAIAVRAGVAARVDRSPDAARRLERAVRLAAAVAPVPPAGLAPGAEPHRRTVFFVRRRERTRYPDVEPAVLIDAAIAHRHPDCETIEEVEAVDPPGNDRQTARPAQPILVVEAREAVFWPRPRRLMIGKDSRTRLTSA